MDVQKKFENVDWASPTSTLPMSLFFGLLCGFIFILLPWSPLQ